MKTHDFYYDLPEELIAQTPLEKRDTSRLCVLNRETGEVTHKHFYDILNYFKKGDFYSSTGPEIKSISFENNVLKAEYAAFCTPLVTFCTVPCTASVVFFLVLLIKSLSQPIKPYLP